MTWITRKRWSFQDIPINIPYFLDAKSTTKRARKIDPKGFEIHLLHACLQKAMPDECSTLGIPLTSYVWIREVELRLLSTPVMFARLVVPYSSLENTFQRIRYLGNQSLGRYLFKLFGITREPFKIKKIQQTDWLYERIMQYQQEKLPILWARHSTFHYKASPLLLTEVFLPQYSQIMKGNF